MARIAGPEAAIEDRCHSHVRGLVPMAAALNPRVVGRCGRRRISLVPRACPSIESP
jgi:hypothetical protein